MTTKLKKGEYFMLISQKDGRKWLCQAHTITRNEVTYVELLFTTKDNWHDAVKKDSLCKGYIVDDGMYYGGKFGWQIIQKIPEPKALALLI